MYSRKSIIVALVLVTVAIGAKKPPKKADAPSQSVEGVPPADAQWTIYCQAVAGPDHVTRSNAFKEQLVAVATSLKSDGWYVLHQDDQSIIYYGFYKTINDPKNKRETERAQRDRTTLQDLKDAGGNKALGACMFVEVTAPDPAAPPQWNLQNALGYWTVEIAMYKEHPQRKQAAVEAVRAAREQGVEAYYYHGQTASSVCIGTWPREAVREQQEQAAASNDPTQDVLVLPAPITVPGEFRNKQGERVQALAPRIEPLDPSLLATMNKYPQRAVNGEVFSVTVKDPVTGQEKQVPDPCVMVRIPTPQGGSMLRQQQHQPAPSLVTPISPSQTPGAGKLRSIGQ